MSRIGSKPLLIPANVTINITADNKVIVEGSKGSMIKEINPLVSLVLKGNVLTVNKNSTEKKAKAMHGLYRMLLHNMVIGVTKGYEKKLEIIGMAYKAAIEGSVLELHIGKSHVTYMKIPEEVTVTIEMVKGKNPATHIYVKGIDKYLVGQIAAKIRDEKPPEPYVTKRHNTQKGIRYFGEELIGKVKKDGK